MFIASNLVGDLTELQNWKFQALATDPSPAVARFYYNTSDQTFRIYNGSIWIKLGTLDQIVVAADVALGGFKITGLGAPTNPNDAVRKTDLDAASQGVSWKASVRAATTTAGALASAFENGDTIDGVLLATGDRILLKNQTAGAENGIYVVNAVGAPTRAADADSAAEIRQAAVFVEEGTANSDTLWVNSTNAAIVLGTTALTFVQLSGATSYAGGNGIVVVGTTISAVVDPAGALTLSASGIAAGPTLPRKHSENIGDGTTLNFGVTHNLGTRDVIVSVRRVAAPYDQVLVDNEATSTSTVTVKFATTPPTVGQYRVTVTG